MGRHSKTTTPTANMFYQLSFLLLTLAVTALCQEIDFGDNAPPRAASSSQVSEGDVDQRFFNLNFDGGQILGTAAGTLLGNIGSDIVKDCFGIGKRSIIMNRLVKRQDRVTAEDVDSRLFCLNNNRPNCNFCNCYSDNACFNQCRKCYSSNSNNNGGNNYNPVDCNYCSCSQCFNACRKCVHNSGGSFGSNSINCSTCSCSY